MNTTLILLILLYQSCPLRALSPRGDLLSLLRQRKKAKKGDPAAQVLAAPKLPIEKAIFAAAVNSCRLRRHSNMHALFSAKTSFSTAASRG
ncbi:MAG: hypothetical protein Q4G42_05515 [Neisseria sp.]|nr:hypothetical protein [Neisseria sp.]